MGMHIVGLGTSRPEHTIRQQDAALMAQACNCRTDRQRRMLMELYRRSAVESRASVLVGADAGNGTPGESAADAVHEFYELPHDGNGHGPTVGRRMDVYAEQALPLATRAAEDALERAGILPGAIDQLVTVSCTGFSAPGLDIRLIGRLGLRRDVGRTMIGFMGCHGAINGLRVASALPSRAALLCCVELCSLHFQYGWNPQQIVSNALFADGAAALVGVTPHDDAPPDNDAPRLIATGSYLIPDSLDGMTWTIKDHGFAMTLSPRVPQIIRQHLRPWLAGWLGEHGYTIEQIEGWAIHPGGPRVISSVESALGLPRGAGDVSRQVLAECGNMSSPTVLFLLDRLWRTNARFDPELTPRRPVVALAFGPGLVAEAALFA